jgi:hypothetical protein
MNIKIKNYRSEVPAETSIRRIEETLIAMGATSIAKEYKDGKVAAISFAIQRGEGIVPFKLPAKKDALKKLFLSKNTRPTEAQSKNAEKQAERTAWKNIKEWVEIQATMIALEQVEFMEVFMPYVFNLQQGKTFFEIAKSNNFKQLV